MPNFPAMKISRERRRSQKKFGFTLFLELPRRAHAWTITNHQIVLNTPKKCLLTARYTKKYLPKFSYLKKSQNVTFQTPKTSFVSLTLKLRSSPLPGHSVQHLKFSIYINDLPNCLLQSKILLYADDAVLFYADSNIGNISTRFE